MYDCIVFRYRYNIYGSDVVELLLDYGARADAEDNNGETVLHGVARLVPGLLSSLLVCLPQPIRMCMTNVILVRSVTVRVAARMCRSTRTP